jgi:response regulator NasT
LSGTDGSPSGGNSGDGIRVLVVDDTDHVRRVLVDMLALDGFEVVGQAADGEEAVRLAGTLDPHVVVMDLRMPTMDGLEATRLIRAARPDQQVVLYTAYLDATVEREAADAGVALCLGKVDGLPRLERELTRLMLAVTRGH